MFAYNTFIAAYGSNDRTIRVLDTTGAVAYTLNVCNYQKSSVNGSSLNISMQDNSTEYSLPFSSNNEAKLAIVAFKVAIDTLRVNCNPSSGSSSSPSTAIAVSYLQYKAMASVAGLTELQWYDVTDSTNLLFQDATYTMRLFAKTNNDKHPRGQLNANQAYVSIDVANNKVLSYEYAANSIYILNSVLYSTFSGSSNISVINNSRVQATNTSYVVVENNSIAVLDTCSNLKISNSSNVTVSNASNCTIDNIQQDLTTMGFNLSNVAIDRNLSVGLAGSNLNVNSGSFGLLAYRDKTDQIINFTNSHNNISITLDNQIVQANAVFRLKYVGSGSNNTIQILDASGDVLFTIVDGYKNCVALFAFNVGNGQFEFKEIELDMSNKLTINTFTPTNNQTVFALTVAPVDSSKLEMFINGQKQLISLDFTYNGSNNTVVYTNRNFSLSTTDEMEIRIY